MTILMIIYLPVHRDCDEEDDDASYDGNNNSLTCR